MFLFKNDGTLSPDIGKLLVGRALKSERWGFHSEQMGSKA